MLSFTKNKLFMNMAIFFIFFIPNILSGDILPHTVNKATELEIAVNENNYNKINSLLDAGYDINEKDSKALKTAIDNQNIDMVNFLLSKNANVNLTKNAQSYSPLSIAIFAASRNYENQKDKENAIKILKIILSKNPDIERGESLYYGGCIRGDDGYTPIFYAVSDENVLKILIDAKANIFHKTSSRQNLLYSAVKSSNQKSVEILLGLGLKPTQKDGSSPLLAIGDLLGNSYIEQSAINIANLLIKNGAYVNAQNYYGNTLLHEAVRTSTRQNLEIAKLLIKNGADLNINKNLGFTPLYLRLSNSFYHNDFEPDFEAVKLLVENGAKVNIKTPTKNQTALDIIYEQTLREMKSTNKQEEDHNKKFEDLKIVKYLRSKGAKLSSELK